MSRNRTVVDASTIENPVTSAVERNEQRQCSPEGRPRLRDEDQVQREDDREHDEHRHEVRGDDRDREQLPRQAHLLHEARLAEQARAGHLDRGLEEDPDEKAAQEEERIVVDRDRAHHDREDQPVREHEHDRVDQRPGDPERGASVLHAQLAPEQVQEQVAIAEEVRVNRHSGPVYADVSSRPMPKQPVETAGRAARRPRPGSRRRAPELRRPADARRKALAAHQAVLRAADRGADALPEDVRARRRAARARPAAPGSSTSAAAPDGSASSSSAAATR